MNYQEIFAIESRAWLQARLNYIWGKAALTAPSPWLEHDTVCPWEGEAYHYIQCFEYGVEELLYASPPVVWDGREVRSLLYLVLGLRTYTVRLEIRQPGQSGTCSQQDVVVETADLQRAVQCADPEAIQTALLATSLEVSPEGKIDPLLRNGCRQILRRIASGDPWDYCPCGDQEASGDPWDYGLSGDQETSRVEMLSELQG